MTTLIDQRILIPAPVNVIWGVLADQSLLPRWRVDCQQVAILTTRQFGVGMRRRCMTTAGKDKVEEITAWYEGLGYEYNLVDSRAYKSWRGRLRLQAVPEGTIVQWTITYEPSNFLQSLLNRLFGAKSQIEEDCVLSLRQLRRLVEQMGHTIVAEQRKSRTLQPVQSVVSASQQIQPVTVEQVEVSIADTKPRKPEGLAEAVKTPPEAMTPALPLQPITPKDSTDSIQAIPAVKTDTSLILDTEPKKEKLPPGMPEILKVTPPQGIPKVDVSRLRYADEVDDEEELASKTPSSREKIVSTQIIRPGLPPPTGADTGKSIWEAFGIQPPSQQDSDALNEIVRQTKEMRKVVIDEPLSTQDTFTFSPLYESSILRVRSMEKVGLRSQQARSHVKVRQSRKS